MVSTKPQGSAFNDEFGQQTRCVFIPACSQKKTSWFVFSVLLVNATLFAKEHDTCRIKKTECPAVTKTILHDVIST